MRSSSELAPSQQSFSFALSDSPAATRLPLEEELTSFQEFGKQTVVSETRVLSGSSPIPTFLNEFWTAQQRACHPIHEISYRACFKPQLPRFFIERLTTPGQVVYDPFMGRGTTLLEAALLGRTPTGTDINPLSRALLQPRLNPPHLKAVSDRIYSLILQPQSELPADLLVFYHPDTLHDLVGLKDYLLARRAAGSFDATDAWIAMIALNRLTGHSPGFFSVYTLPPNQAVSVESQRKINAKRNQTPPKRDARRLILKKTAQLLKSLTSEDRERLGRANAKAQLLTADARSTPTLPSESVDLIVTSPPFLDVVQYDVDNWLRCWFLGMDSKEIAISMLSTEKAWQKFATEVFHELSRILRSGGSIAFEVGEVNRGKLKLEELVIPAGIDAGLRPRLLLINAQKFTKTANCWGVSNQEKGTNSNRIVLFTKP